MSSALVQAGMVRPDRSEHQFGVRMRGVQWPALVLPGQCGATTAAAADCAIEEAGTARAYHLEVGAAL